ncbi:MAG: hypothetical protein R2940_17830 [Syntrophotaleaceae bacterium]
MFKPIMKTCICSMLLLFVTTGCATQISKPKSQPQPAKVRLGTFSTVEMREVQISPDFADAAANKKAAKKINEIICRDMKVIFPKLKVLAANEDFSGSKGSLQITPVIKEIKFIGGAARFWLGAMAGSSAVLMQVDYRNGQTGEVIAEPEFLEVASAFAGGWSIGATDNHMLEKVAMDVTSYTTLYR